jgi:hypothetical protein
MENVDFLSRFVETQGLATFLVVGGALFFATRMWPDLKSGGVAFLRVVERGVVALENAVVEVHSLVDVQKSRANGDGDRAINLPGHDHQTEA